MIRTHLITLIIFIVALFGMQPAFAYISPPINDAYNEEIVWGQAYSPNIGWINFYCDGDSNTQPNEDPLYVRVNYSNKGAKLMPLFCSDIAYETKFDPNTKQFSGIAYSSNYGWLDMSGVHMDDIPTIDLTDINIEGKSNGVILGDPYNFGITYFEAGDPNAFNPGAQYFNDKGYFCGFAYSDSVGYISLCDPQSKEKAPKNISMPGFDFNTYAVYMGTGNDDGLIIGAPAMSSPEQIFAATDNYHKTLWFIDDTSDIDSVEVKIYDATGAQKTYTADYFDPIQKRAAVNIMNHDFSLVGKYDLVYTICDDEGICNADYTEADFFTVVAAVPSFLNPANSFFSFSTVEKVADGTEQHIVEMTLADAYGNTIKSVEDVKEVKANFKFENTTKLNQIIDTGDSALFESAEFNLLQTGGNSTGYLTEAIDGDGIFKINIKSYAPTSIGYAPIADDDINLFFDEVELEITTLNGHNNVGEISAIYGSTDENRKFAFMPTLAATPQALVWNSLSDAYEIDSSGVENITVNAPKRFAMSLENQSNAEDASSLGLGVAINNGADSSVIWENGIIEKAGTTTGLSEILEIDTDENIELNIPIKILTWISSVLTRNIDQSFRFRATATLDAGGSTAGNLSTILQTYACYTISSKDICHRGGKLEKSPDVMASLYNPDVEIIGVVRSTGGTSSKQSSDALNQSIGDILQNEFKTSVKRNTATFTQNTVDTDCSTGNLTISDFANFWSAYSDCIHMDGSVLYLTGDVTMEAASPDTFITLPNKVTTILIADGNLHLKSNLTYPANDPQSFGIIVLKGDVFVYPNVTNVIGALYAEGALISVNADGEYGEDLSASCDETGFCDRSYELRNQLYWKGLIATQNTIGGSDKATIECPTGIVCSSREIARIYDLAYLRTFHPNSGGAQVYTESDSAFVIKYDSRVQTTPPPLFESTIDKSDEETSY
jgi:hypothetical protein